MDALALLQPTLIVGGTATVVVAAFWRLFGLSSEARRLEAPWLATLVVALLGLLLAVYGETGSLR